jgi:hypothetical protein
VSSGQISVLSTEGVVQKCFTDANFHRFVLAGDLLVKLPGKICAGRHAGAYKSR